MGPSKAATLETASPISHPSASPDARRARQGFDMAVRYLRAMEPTDAVRELVARAERLEAEMDAWSEVPPTVEARDAAVRRALSIQVAVLSLARRRPRGAAIG